MGPLKLDEMGTQLKRIPHSESQINKVVSYNHARTVNTLLLPEFRPLRPHI